MVWNNNQLAFFSLVKGGLWEQEVQLFQFNRIDFDEVLRLAEEQSVVGLVTAGLEHINDAKVPKENVLSFVGRALQIEQRNHKMNKFVARLIDKLNKEDIDVILVKGQGIAQCYERPYWRVCGDVDLLLDTANYQKAKSVLQPIAQIVETEYKNRLHQGLTINDEVVELHGSLRGSISDYINEIIDTAQKECIDNRKVRKWVNNGIVVYLPSADNDIIFVFTHILHHYYLEGIGLRQICDWCRLVWTFRSEIDVILLEQRLLKARLLSEWKALAALAVDWLGMPTVAMPLYSADKKWSRKAERIIEFVLECGNFGHNRQAYKGKVDIAWNKLKDFANHALVFPWDSIQFFFHFLRDRITVTTSKDEK